MIHPALIVFLARLHHQMFRVWVRDVFEDLDAVTLVGNSSGGSVITGVGDRLPDRVERVVYLDAFLPSDGQSTGELVPPDRWDAATHVSLSTGGQRLHNPALTGRIAS